MSKQIDRIVLAQRGRASHFASLNYHTNEELWSTGLVGKPFTGFKTFSVQENKSNNGIMLLVHGQFTNAKNRPYISELCIGMRLVYPEKIWLYNGHNNIMTYQRKPWQLHVIGLDIRVYVTLPGSIMLYTYAATFDYLCAANLHR